MSAQELQHGVSAPLGCRFCRWLGPHVALVSYDGRMSVLKQAASVADSALISNEARILRRLEGLGIAPKLLGQGGRGGDSWLLMEYIEGRHPEPPLAASDLAALECAIHAAHQRMVVHCDLKPSNIVLRDGRAWLIDWALAATPGQSTESLPHRPYSSGWTHPDLIWGHGNLASEHDLHVLARLQGTTWQEQQAGYVE